MKISEQRNQLNQLVDNQKSLVSAKEREIEKLKSFYAKKLEDERSLGDQNISATRNREQQKNEQLITAEQEKLEEIKQNLTGQMQRLEKEKEILTASHKVAVNDLLEQQKQEQQDKFEQTRDLSQKLSSDVQLFTKKITDKSDLEMQSQHQEAKIRLDQQSSLNEGKITQDQKQYENLSLSKELAFHKKINDDQLLFDKKMQDNYKRLEGKEDQQTAIYDKRIKDKEKFYSDLIVQKDESFKKKVELQKQSHDSLIKRITENFNLEMNKMMDHNAATKNAMSSRSEDQFYNIAKLDPTIRDEGKHYIVEITTPEYEKENYVVSADGRQVKISMARRFDYRSTNEDGETNINKKSEIFTKLLPTTELVNSRDISQQYLDGKLVVKVAKL